MGVPSPFWQDLNEQDLRDIETLQETILELLHKSEVIDKMIWETAMSRFEINPGEPLTSFQEEALCMCQLEVYRQLFRTLA